MGRFRAAFVAERQRLIARRLPFAGRCFVMSIGMAAVIDATFHPERTSLLLGIFLSQIILCLVAVRLVGRPALVKHAGMVAGAITITVAVIAIAYLIRVGASPDRVGIVLVCLLTGSSLLLPWGGAIQAVVSAAISAAFIGLLWGTGATSHLGALALPALVIAVLSWIGAMHIDGYREDAFVRASLEAEEARTSTALARVGAALHVHLHDADLLDRVCGVARDELPSDWVALYLLDEASGHFHLRGFAAQGDAPDRDALSAHAPAPGSGAPLLEELERVDLVEIRDGERQTLVPRTLVAQLRVGAALYTPIRHEGRLVGSIAYGFVTRRPYFTEAQRRLVRGIAHLTAVAVENVRLIEQLAEASRLKTEFVATMSHELRTPLSVISGYTNLMDEEVFGPITTQQRDTLARIRQSSFALLELVTMTLDLGRLETGRDAVTPELVSVHELADEIQAEQQTLVPIEVRYRWRYDLELEVYVDRGKLKTILKNLVGNALKFTTRGHVDVQLVWHEEMLRITVEDTGIGIAPEDRDAVFELFRQVDGSSTRRYDGTGLGLHIVQRLTTLLGGAVEVESEPDHGSTFRVRIPCPRADLGARRIA